MRSVVDKSSPGRDWRNKTGVFRVHHKKAISIRKDKEPGSLSKLPREKLRHLTLGVKTYGRPNKSRGWGPLIGVSVRG